MRSVLIFLTLALVGLATTTSYAERRCGAQNNEGEYCNIECAGERETANCQDGEFGDAPVCRCESPPKPIHSLSIEGVPIHSRGPFQAQRHVMFFLSPTCNHCNRLYMEAMDALGDVESEISQSTEFTFALYPRQHEDIPIIATLLCVPENQYSAAVHEYQKALWNEYHGRAVSKAFAKSASVSIAKQLGVDTSRIADCQSSTEVLAAIQMVYRTGREYPNSNVPIVVVDGKPLHIITYQNAWSELRSNLRR